MLNLSEMSDEQLKMIAGLTESRVMSVSKDDLRMHEEQLLWTPKLEKEVFEYWSTLNGYWKARTMPACTCANHDGGFMAKRSAKGKFYNDFFYEEEPCSLKWFNKCKEEGRVQAYDSKAAPQYANTH